MIHIENIHKKLMKLHRTTTKNFLKMQNKSFTRNSKRMCLQSVIHCRRIAKKKSNLCWNSGSIDLLLCLLYV